MSINNRLSDTQDPQDIPNQIAPSPPDQHKVGNADGRSFAPVSAKLSAISNTIQSVATNNLKPNGGSAVQNRPVNPKIAEKQEQIKLNDNAIETNNGFIEGYKNQMRPGEDNSRLEHFQQQHEESNRILESKNQALKDEISELERGGNGKATRLSETPKPVQTEASKVATEITSFLMKNNFKLINRIPVINNIATNSLKKQIETRLATKQLGGEPAAFQKLKVRCLTSKTLLLDESGNVLLKDKLKAEGSFKKVRGYFNIETNETLVISKAKKGDYKDYIEKTMNREMVLIDTILKEAELKKAENAGRTIQGLPLKSQSWAVYRNKPSGSGTVELERVQTNAVLSARCVDGETKSKDLSFTKLERLRAVKQIADALAFTTSMGITHGDVKPANILFDRKGSAHIADLDGVGIAGEADGRPTIFTASYVNTSPDRQLTNELRYDAYALRITAYELLTGGSFDQFGVFREKVLKRQYGDELGGQLYQLFCTGKTSSCQEVFNQMSKILDAKDVVDKMDVRLSSLPSILSLF